MSRSSTLAHTSSASAASSKVDAYIEKAAPFAQPILTHLRELIHATVPGAEEAVKWSMPFFLYKGLMLANFAAFKAHCNFRIWNGKLQSAANSGADNDGEAGSFDKVTSEKDLPSDRQLRAMLLDAVRKIDAGERTTNWDSRAKKDRPEIALPEALTVALQQNPAAAKQFSAFSPSCRREYVQWIAEAKRDETRERRIREAVAMITEGKSRNAKYETKR